MPELIRVRIFGVPIAGRTRDDLLEEAEAFGVAGRFELIENAAQDEIRRSLGRSKLFAALSHREGSYVGVAEALVAGTPVVMFADAKVGTKAYINEQTGLLVDPSSPLGPQLTAALGAFDHRATRQWAIENMSSVANCRKLNDLLAADFRAQGLHWTVNAEPFYCVRFDFFRYSSAAESDRARDRLATDYGLVIR